MNFKPMDPNEVWRLLEATDAAGKKIHEDLITPALKKEEAFFRTVSCPSCGGYSHTPFLNPRRPFAPGSVLPNRLLRCLECETEFDPNTRLVLRVRPG